MIDCPRVCIEDYRDSSSIYRGLLRFLEFSRVFIEFSRVFIEFSRVLSSIIEYKSCLGFCETCALLENIYYTYFCIYFTHIVYDALTPIGRGRVTCIETYYPWNYPLYNRQHILNAQA